MKKTVKTMFAAAFMLLAFTATAQAGTSANVSNNQSGKFALAANEGEVKTDSAKIMEFLLDDRLTTLKVTKVIMTGENGDTLRYDDGSVKYFCYFADKDGNLYNLTIVDLLLKVRSNATKAILGNVGLGAAVGAIGGLLSGGGAEAALKGGAAGVVTGVVASADKIAQIKKINKNLKPLRKMLKPYRETFTEEGLPKDPKADLSKVKGLGDLDKAEALSKEALEVKSQLDASMANATDLADIDMSKL